jgi:site-specific recombinase
MSNKTKKKKINLVDHFRDNQIEISAGDRITSLTYLRDFIALIRTGSRETEKAETKLQAVIKLLHEHPNVMANVRRSILVNLKNTNLVPMLTDSGMALSRSVGKELYSRLKHKFIPPETDQRDFLYVINAVFYKDKDFKWVEKITRETWIQFFELLGLSFRGSEPILAEQVMLSMQILSARIAQLGWEKELVEHLPLSPMERENPFMVQQYLLRELRNVMDRGNNDLVRDKATALKRSLDECKITIQTIRENTLEKGASLAQSFVLFQLEQKLERMLLLTDLVDADRQFNTGRLAEYFINVVRNENRRNSLRELLSQTTGYLAYQIAEQKGKKGTGYITSSPAEYRKMISSAMWGGFIVCFVAIIKNLLSLLKMAPFWQGFMYSVNYSLGFIVIEETKSTLATKQPAFTASAVAVSLDTRKSAGKPNLLNLAVTISKISRSQIASFLGNLIIVFPVTFLFCYAIDLAFHFKIAEGTKAMNLLRDQHPWQSLSLLYACNTGVFLFISGIIAGYVQNKMKYSRIAERIIEHPFLRFYFARPRLNKIARYWEAHAGSIIGNIALGFFLGMASTVGKIFGLPFDIRHITIAAGNTSIGLYGIGWENISKTYLAIVVLGVLGIGLLNFLVSFSLAFIVAVRSRGIRLSEYPEFLGILWKYFKSNPLDFIRPRKRISYDIQEPEA